MKCLFISSTFLQVHWEKQTKETTYLSFLVCLSHLHCTFPQVHWEKQARKIHRFVFLIYPPTGTLRKTDKKNRPICRFLSVFKCTCRCTGKRTRKIYIPICVVCFSHLPYYRYTGNNRQEKYTYFFSCLFISSTFLQVHSKKTDKKNKLFVFLVCFSHLPSYWYTEKNRQEKYNHLSFLSVFKNPTCPPTGTLGKTDKKNTPICLSCPFFSSALLHVPWEKQTRKIYTYLSFLSVFLICSPIGTLRKTDKKNITICLSCLFFKISSAILQVHWKNRQEKYTYWFVLSVFLIYLPTGTLGKTDKKNTLFCLSCLFISSTFLQLHLQKQTRKIHLFVFFLCFFSSARLQIH